MAGPSVGPARVIPSAPVGRLAAGAAAASAATTTSVAEPTLPAPALSTVFEEPCGLQIASLRLISSNSVVAVAYRVVAPAKAAFITSDRSDVYLLDLASGTKLQMLTPPRDGTESTNLRPSSAARFRRQAVEAPPPSNRFLPGKTYLLLLPNPDETVQPGSKVALVVGDFRADDLTVE